MNMNISKLSIHPHLFFEAQGGGRRERKDRHKEQFANFLRMTGNILDWSIPSDILKGP